MSSPVPVQVQCERFYIKPYNPFVQPASQCAYTIRPLSHQTAITFITFTGFLIPLYSPPGGATLADGVSDLRNAITAFEALDGSFIDKLHDFNELRVSAKTKYSQTRF